MSAVLGPITETELERGKGIRGDRYHQGAGTFRRNVVTQGVRLCEPCA